MNKLRTLCLFTLLFIGLSPSVFAQELEEEADYKKCSTAYLPMSPTDISHYVASMETNVSAYRMSEDSVIIPCVIQNVHYNHVGYVSDARLLVMFDKMNDALANRGAFYDPLGVDTGIRLCLAKVDPDGNPSSGIVHTEDRLGWDHYWYYYAGSFHKGVQWDKKRYLNIYIMNVELGVAVFPWSPAEDLDNGNFSGFMIHTDLIGTREGITTLFHEIGHYLGLYHTYQTDLTGYCSNDLCLERSDMVCDTPPDIDNYTPCWEYTNTCDTDVNADDPNNPFTEDQYDMIRNYMDGSPCRSRFTQGQVDRMHWVLQTYRPELIEEVTNRCANCTPILVKMQASVDDALVGDTVIFKNTSEVEGAIDYQWYVNDSLIIANEDLLLHVDNAGVYRVRLEAHYTAGGPICQGNWYAEQSIAFRCTDEEVQVHHATDYYERDSCYIITIDGLGEYAWQINETIGMDNPIEFCPDSSGIYTILLNYGADVCAKKDSIRIAVYEKGHRQHQYFKQRMRFSDDTLFGPQIMQFEQLNPYRYLLTGSQRYHFSDRDIFPPTSNTARNFIRFWEPQAGLMEEWRLAYQDSIVTFLPFDIVQDETGHLYQLTLERYINASQNSSIIFTKINALGRIVWSKRLRLPKQFSYPFRSDENTRNFVKLQEDKIILYVKHHLFEFTKAGDLIDAKQIYTLPFEFHEGHFTPRIGKSFMDSTYLWHFGKCYVYEPDSIGMTSDLSGQNALSIAMWNTETDAFVQKTYQNEDNFYIRGNTCTISPHPNGAAVYWQTTVTNGLYHDIGVLNNEGEFVWRKTILTNATEADNFAENFPGEESHIFVLENQDIVVLTNTDQGPFFSIFHFDKNGNLLYHKDYDNDFDPYTFIRGQNRAFMNNKSATWGQDGFIVTSAIEEYLSERIMVRHIPLDTTYYSCENEAYPVQIVDRPLEEITAPPSVIMPIEAYVEDIELHIEKLFFEMDLWCEETHEAEDYSIEAINTTLLCPDSLLITSHICRTQSALTDTITALLFHQNPLEIDAAIEQTKTLTFAANQKCIIVDWYTTSEDHHLLLNAKADYRRPYTLKQAFFDGHQKLEWEYRNNHTLIEAECVSTATNVIAPLQITIFPNPTKAKINIHLEKGILQQVNLYNIVGQLQQSKNPQTSTLELGVQDYVSGIYFLEILTDTGLQLREKIVIE